jgi:hypothetical protein
MKKRRLYNIIAVVIALSIMALPLAVSASVTLVSPKYGVANETSFNLSIKTASSTTCRYSTPFSKAYSEMTDFTISDSTFHRRNLTLPENGQAYPFFVECANSEKATFDLSVDTSPPYLTSVSASPTTIIETPFQTHLVVDTSDNSTCRYDDQFYTFDTMRNSFTPLLIEYEKHHETVVSGFSDKTAYLFNVSCRNQAELESSLAKINFKVDTSIPAGIVTILTSNGFGTTSSSVTLSVTTTKKSVCSYDNSTEYKYSDGNFSMTTVNHQAGLYLSPGAYTYYIKCLFEGPSQLTGQTSFYVDNTAPSVPEINISQKGVDEGYTYYLDRLEIKFNSTDAESGVGYYNYSIIDDSDKTVLDWTLTGEKSITATGFTFKNGAQYVVKASALNKAGMASAVSKSSAVTVNVLLNSDYACSDRVKDGEESDIDCGGDCKLKCGNGKDCSINSDCKTSFCVKGVCRAGNCTDGYQNQGESDVDCGGSCSTKCSVNKKCTKAYDCETGICNEGYCVPEGPCSNKMLDASETDIDCGGICASTKSKKCAVGKNCEYNSDCQSGVCSPSGMCANQNDLDGDLILNLNDNCPEIANTEQKDSDKDKKGDVCDDDNDNDGMPDEWEKKYGLNTLSSSDASIDSDKDEISNLEEYNIGTNPRKKDSDDDGANDNEEVKAGTDPKDSNSKPGMGGRTLLLIVLFFVAAGFVIVIAYIGVRKKKEVDDMFNGNTALSPLDAEGNDDFTPPMQSQRKQIVQNQFQQQMEGRPQQQPMQQFQRPQQQQMPQNNQDFQQQRQYPPQQYQQHPSNPYSYRHEVFDKLHQEYSKMSGEQLFDELRKKTRR